MLIDPMADLDGFLTIAEQYAALGIDLINIMPPEDTTDPVTFASRLGEHVIPRVAQIECGRNSAANTNRRTLRGGDPESAGQQRAADGG